MVAGILKRNGLAIKKAISAALFSALVLPASATTSTRPASATGLQSMHGAPQRAGRPPRKSAIDSRVARLGTQLNLNDVQRFDLKRLLETQQAEANRLWNNQEIDPMQRMTRLRNLQEDTHKRFSALLTEEQRKKYEQLREKAARAAAQPQASEKNHQP